MRASISPADYKHIVLPLIFLRYLSLRYEKRRAEIEEMVKKEWASASPEVQQEILNDPDQYISQQVYIIPDDARWSFLVKNAKAANIKALVDNAMTLIADENKELQGILPRRIYQTSNLPAENLTELINIFSREKFSTQNHQSVDVLGRVYEYFIGTFASTEGQRGGEFYTPSSIVSLLVAMLEPIAGTVFDPACGSGGMFIQSEKYTKNKHALSFYGQEVIENTVRLGKMNVLLHGINAEIRLGNSLLKDSYKGQQFDYVISNPPFNMKLWGADNILDDDPRLIGPISNSNANYMWMQHFLYHLKEGGTAGFVMANGAMSSNTTSDKDVRQRLISGGYVDCIVQLPEKLFFTTTIPCSLFFFSKNRDGQKGFRNRRDEILFIDARQKGSLVSRKQRALSQDEIDEIASVYHRYRTEGATYEDISGFCKVAKLVDIEKNDYKLTPGIYVGTEVNEDDGGEPFEEKIMTLQELLLHQFRESQVLQEKIVRNLEELL
ncbi:N-6 DNA methylase [Alicyclobacillus sp. TC]|nr:N-6 DNA methylase [Alicyclobacillus sp. TC]